MNVAILLSCGSFEGFFGRVQGQSRQSYLESYRNDWAWYYGRGLLENGIHPVLYIPALYEAGKYETDAGIPVRFLPLARWYRPMSIDRSSAVAQTAKPGDAVVPCTPKR